MTQNVLTSQEPYRAATNRLKLPSYALLCCALFNFFLLTMVLVNILVAPEQEQMYQQLQEISPTLADMTRTYQKDMEQQSLAQQLLSPLLGFIIGILQFIASFMMRNLRKHRLCLTAAVLSILPCGCCCFSLPVGLWCIVVLQRKDIKPLFQ